MTLSPRLVQSEFHIPKDIFDPIEFRYTLTEAKNSAGLCRTVISKVNDFFAEQFEASTDPIHLVYGRADFMDGLLQALWSKIVGETTNGLALIAVGGYGRQELHPYSDIDLLILAKDEEILANFSEALTEFITCLWDLKLEIGHSVRTISDCVDVAKNDLTIITTLVETHHISGDPRLFKTLQNQISPNKMWNSHDFFAAKRDEQRDRHRKYANTEYNLEPNIKTSPGGLRDIHLITWVARRHYGVEHLSELVELGFISNNEYQLIQENMRYLWRIRYSLHCLAGRHEDRLLFDHQRSLAKEYGYKDTKKSLAVEKFMKVYYRCAASISAINELLTQHFEEAILRACENEEILDINERFRIRNGYIEAANDRVFKQTPSALMEIFVLLAQTPNIHGVRATTIRAIREHADLIDDNFRKDPRNNAFFVQLLNSRFKITTQLRRMMRYGILGKYIPEFGKIMGQMQHDLFHVYTVDAHTLQVINNMRRFTYDNQAEKFPIAHAILKRMAKPDLLYIAGLYHDIAKGRGGDHSTLGAVDAIEFCLQHGYTKRDANLVAWLVEKHLLMSSVSQRKDISDPEVIHDFAVEMGDQLHLDYLYALTAADMRATNTTIWNTWRASLMRQLYNETRRALRRGLENVIDKADWIADTRELAMRKLEERGISRKDSDILLGDPGEDYFLRETVDDIVWQIDALHKHKDKSKPLILLKEYDKRAFEGATQLFVLAPDRKGLFSDITNALEQLNLSVQDAKIYNSTNKNAIDTFILLDAEGLPIGEDANRLAHIKDFVYEVLTSPEAAQEVQKRTPRQQKHFISPTQVTVTTDIVRNQTVIEVHTPDRPGLLANVARVFTEFDIALQNAKITTLGEKVEDVFFVTDDNLNPISDPDVCLAIQERICQQLDNRPSH